MPLSPPPESDLPLRAFDTHESPPRPLVEQLYEDLRARNGPILGGADLAKAMGYRSLAAFRQARRRGQVEVVLFTLPNCRGVFALGLDVARWLADARQTNLVSVHDSKDADRMLGPPSLQHSHCVPHQTECYVLTYDAPGWLGGLRLTANITCQEGESP